MNGDFTKTGQDLIDGYYKIVHRADYTHIKKHIPKDNTDRILKSNALDKNEKMLLRSQSNLVESLLNDKRRRPVNNLPRESNIKLSDLPKHCYYRPEYKHRGDHFIVEKHPKQNGRIWQSSTSRLVSLEDKYNDLLEYLNTLSE
jgi:hypothetical protein